MATKVDTYSKIKDLREYLESKGFYKIESDDPLADYQETCERYTKVSQLSQEILFAGMDRVMEISLEITSGNKEN